MNNLKITTTDAQIEIQTTRGSYKIQEQKGQQSIVQRKVKLNIDKQAPRVIIDTYEQRAEKGLKNNMDLLVDAAQLGRQSTLQAIGRIVADGNRMADIRKTAPPAIPELAAKNSKPPIRQFNVGLLPKSRPKIDVEGYINIDWKLGGADIDYSPSKLHINYNKGNVDIYTKQKQDINIEHIDTRG